MDQVLSDHRIHCRRTDGRGCGSFPAGSTIGPEELETAGVLRGKTGPVKVLGQGDLSVGLTVRAHKFSAGARQKIESAGGSVELIDGAAPESSE